MSNKQITHTVRGLSPEAQGLYENMKKRLYAFRELEVEIEFEEERLDRLKSKAYSPSGGSLTGMPKSGTVYDRTGELVIRLEALEKHITSLKKQRESERSRLEYLVRKLRKSGDRALIRARYLDREEWDDVQFVLFGDKEDFNEKFEDYRQRMFRWHRNAIVEMAEKNRQYRQ